MRRCFRLYLVTEEPAGCIFCCCLWDTLTPCSCYCYCYCYYCCCCSSYFLLLLSLVVLFSSPSPPTPILLLLLPLLFKKYVYHHIDMTLWSALSVQPRYWPSPLQNPPASAFGDPTESLSQGEPKKPRNFPRKGPGLRLGGSRDPGKIFPWS